jgi:hypothetical protein
MELAKLFGDALQGHPSSMEGTVRPALMGCPDCRTRRMIAGPALGICQDCGGDLQFL